MQRNLGFISLYQPFASFIPQFKKYETRSRYCGFRGWVVICAALNKSCCDHYDFLKYKYDSLADLPAFSDLPFGKTVALMKLTNCYRMANTDNELNERNVIDIRSQTDLELGLGDWQPGRYALELTQGIVLPPFPIKGQQFVPFFDVPGDKIHQIKEYALEQGITI